MSISLDAFPASPQPVNVPSPSIAVPPAPPAPPAPAASAPDTSASAQAHVVQFTGRGGEFFRIWIVNVSLTLLKLGIYAAWAKVRTTRYFYRHTSIAGAAFDYHVRPLALFKGYVAGLFLFIAYLSLDYFFGIWGTLTGAAIVFLGTPWLIYRSMRYTLANTSWRGLRFGFDCTLGKAYLNIGVWTALSICTAYLLLPLAHKRIESYLVNGSRYGTDHFEFSARGKSFYAIYGTFFGLLLVAILGVSTIVYQLFGPGQPYASSVTTGITVTFLLLYGVIASLTPMLTLRLYNLTWSHTALGPHRLIARAPLGRGLRLHVANVLLTICTLGLYLPYAKVKWLKFLAASTTVVLADGIDDYVAGQNTAQTQSLADGIGDVLGVDMAF